MLKKFDIDYIVFPEHNHRVLTHRTNDPVEAEEFLAHLLAVGAKITAIRHNADELTAQQFDRMIRVAAEGLISRLLEASLGVDSAEVRHRFKFAA